MMKNEWARISLVFLFLVALIGTLMRAAGVVNAPFQYTHLLHAHSHVAFQGWVYLIMMLLLTRTFLDGTQVEKGRYPLQFKLTVFVVIGVLVSFALQGYGLYSIIFSTLFQGLNYWFIFRFLKDSKSSKAYSSGDISLRLVRTGLWFGLLSTLLPYAVGILSARGLNGTEAYRSLVYTFLHLQYNGWFLLVVLGLFFDYLDRRGVGYRQKHAKTFYWLLTLSVIPATALSLLGMEFTKDIMAVAYLAAALSAGTLILFAMAVPKNLLASLKAEQPWFRVYFIAFLISFLLKTVLMSLSVLPAFISYAAYNKFIIIAYLHLSLIGSITFLLLALMLEKNWLPKGIPVRSGSVLFIAGFAVTELLLVFAGLGVYYNQTSLIVGSSAMALGILLMIFSGKALRSELKIPVLFLFCLSPVIFFSCQQEKTGQLKLMSYNIRHGQGMDTILDLSRAAEIIKAQSPDLCALQEVDEFCTRSDSIGQTDYLAQSTNTTGTFGRFMDYQGGQYGMATLSARPLVSTKILQLPDGLHEPRSSIIQEVQIAEGHSIVFANVHLDWIEGEQGENSRLNQAKTLMQFLDKTKKATIIAGDFNCSPDSPTMAYFLAHGFEFIEKGADHLSFQGTEKAEIDHVIFRNSNREKFKVKSIGLLDAPVASDHRPLIVELEVIY